MSSIFPKLREKQKSHKVAPMASNKKAMGPSSVTHGSHSRYGKALWVTLAEVKIKIEKRCDAIHKTFL